MDIATHRLRTWEDGSSQSEQERADESVRASAQNPNAGDADDDEPMAGIEAVARIVYTSPSASIINAKCPAPFAAEGQRLVAI